MLNDLGPVTSATYEESDAEKVARLQEEPPLEMKDKGFDFGKAVLVSLYINTLCYMLQHILLHDIIIMFVGMKFEMS